MKPHIHILLAEDEPHTRLSLSIILRKAGYDVTAVSNGQEAMNCLQAGEKTGICSFAVLVMDFQMPVMTGREVLLSLQKRETSPPVIIVTGYGDRKLVKDLSRNGCVRVIHKPFEPRELVDAVNGICDPICVPASSRNVRIKDQPIQTI